jgi:hypothetical protein
LTGSKSGIPVVRWTNSPSTNHRQCAPRDGQILESLRRLHARRVRHVEHPHASGLLPLLQRLIGDDERLADKAEGVAAGHTWRGRRKLRDHRGRLGPRHVDNTQTRLLSFVREVQPAAAVGPLLDGQPFAAVAVSVEICLADQLDVAGPRARSR